jgi:hypothetical protein
VVAWAAGMPIPTNEEIRAARARAIYAEDEASEVRKSYENPPSRESIGNSWWKDPAGTESQTLAYALYSAWEEISVTLLSYLSLKGQSNIKIALF